MCKTTARREMDPTHAMKYSSHRTRSGVDTGAPHTCSKVSPHGRPHSTYNSSLGRSNSRGTISRRPAGASSHGSISSLDYHYAHSSSNGPYHPRMSSHMSSSVMRVVGKPQGPRPHPTRQHRHHTQPHKAASSSLSQSVMSSSSVFSQPSRRTHHRRPHPPPRQHRQPKKQRSIQWLGVCWCCYRASEACSCSLPPPRRAPSSALKKATTRRSRQPSQKPISVTLRRASFLFHTLLRLLRRRVSRPLPPSPRSATYPEESPSTDSDSDSTHEGQKEEEGQAVKGDKLEGEEKGGTEEVKEEGEEGGKEGETREEGKEEGGKEGESRVEGTKEERGESWLAATWHTIRQTILPTPLSVEEQARGEETIQPTLEDKAQQTELTTTAEQAQAVQPKVEERVEGEGEEGGLTARAAGLGIEEHGYLHKKSHTFFRAWQRRYFFLHDSMLKYVASEGEFEAMIRSGVVEGREVCHTVTCRASPHPHKGRHMLTLQLNRPPQGRDRGGCTYMLQAGSGEEASRWMEAINSAVAKYLDAQAQGPTSSRGGLLSRVRGHVSSLACGDCHTSGGGGGAGGGEGLEWWASLGLGVLVCTRCAGSHRALGAHVTQVKSVLLDEWSEHEAHRLTHAAHTHHHTLLSSLPSLDATQPSSSKAQGTHDATQPTHSGGMEMELQDLNALTNAALFVHVPEGMKGLSECSTAEEREEFIRHKYMHKTFSVKNNIINSN